MTTSLLIGLFFNKAWLHFWWREVTNKHTNDLLYMCVGEWVCVRGRNGWREEVRKALRERENVFVSSSSWPLLFPKGSFGKQTLHCIIAGKDRRDSGLQDLWIVASGSIVLAGNRLTHDRTTTILCWWDILSNRRFYNAFQLLISPRFAIWWRKGMCIWGERVMPASHTPEPHDWNLMWSAVPHCHQEDSMRSAACVSILSFHLHTLRFL